MNSNNILVTQDLSVLLGSLKVVREYDIDWSITELLAVFFDGCVAFDGVSLRQSAIFS